MLMKIDAAISMARSLTPGESRDIYVSGKGTTCVVTRTDKICPYDFAVSLRIPGQVQFRPTHVRLFFDLYLKRIANPSLARRLFGAADAIYQGGDPEEIGSYVVAFDFPMQLDDPDTNLYYMQLLMVEQENNYGPLGCKQGKVQPAREFMMRFIRWIASGNDELDRVIQNAVRNYPPPVAYAKWVSGSFEPLVTR